MLELPDLAIGATLAALITGILSLLGLVISKEQKNSEFRQEWIDSLRSEIAKLIAHINSAHGGFISHDGNLDELWKIVREDYVGINEATAKIRLRLNPTENNSKKILDSIDDLEKLFKENKMYNYQILDQFEKQLVDRSRVVMKIEWNRVKRGEPTYRAAKYSAIFIIFLTIITLAISAARAYV